MAENKNNEGITVKEIERLAKKHRFEVFFCLSFLFACFFSFIFFGIGWAILLASIGGILGVLLPQKIDQMTRKMFQFVFKQESTSQLIFGIVLLIVSIFLPPLVFLLIGMHGGKSLEQLAVELGKNF